MESTVMFVRSLGCNDVVTFRVMPEFDLDLEAVVDRVRERILSTYTAIEGERIVGDQGAVFWEFRLPWKNYQVRKELLLGQLEVVESQVAEAMKVKSALELLNE